MGDNVYFLPPHFAIRIHPNRIVDGVRHPNRICFHISILFPHFAIKIHLRSILSPQKALTSIFSLYIFRERSSHRKFCYRSHCKCCDPFKSL